MKLKPWSRSLSLRITLGALVIAVFAAGCGSLEVRERELVFRPVKGEAGWYAGTPAAIQDLYLPVNDSPDAQKIHAWWYPAPDPGAPALLYLHGVRWNLTGHLRRIEQLHSLGYSVFAIDYRGFGTSDGDLPSEQLVYEDARAAWAWLVQKVPDPDRRYIYGHSLGGAVAIDLAASLAGKSAQARGLIVESTFTSLAEIATELVGGWLPTSVLTQKFDSIDKIKTVDIPVLIVHGTGDRLVAPHFSEALYAAARDPKKLVMVENASHNNSMWLGITAYQQGMTDLFGFPGAVAGNRTALH